jgi:hypothetical protein
MDRAAILCPKRKTSVYTDASHSASDSLSDCMAPCCPGAKCFPKFVASRKIQFVKDFGDRDRLVSEEKSDRESDLHANRTENRMCNHRCRRTLTRRSNPGGAMRNTFVSQKIEFFARGLTRELGMQGICRI